MVVEAVTAGAGVVVQATPLFTSTRAWVGVLSTPTIPSTGAGASFSCLGRLGGRACCWGRGSCCVVGCGWVVVVAAVVIVGCFCCCDWVVCWGCVVIVGCFCVVSFVVVLLFDC